MTSQSSAKSPDFVAIVSTKEGKELGRVRLVTPKGYRKRYYQFP
ncbi:hypothetical protein AB6G58_04455 [Providencia huaxiensis]